VLPRAETGADEKENIVKEFPNVGCATLISDDATGCIFAVSQTF